MAEYFQTFVVAFLVCIITHVVIARAQCMGRSHSLVGVWVTGFHRFKHPNIWRQEYFWRFSFFRRFLSVSFFAGWKEKGSSNGSVAPTQRSGFQRMSQIMSHDLMKNRPTVEPNPSKSRRDVPESRPMAQGVFEERDGRPKRCLVFQ